MKAKKKTKEVVTKKTVATYILTLDQDELDIIRSMIHSFTAHEIRGMTNIATYDISEDKIATLQEELVKIK